MNKKEEGPVRAFRKKQKITTIIYEKYEQSLITGGI